MHQSKKPFGNTGGLFGFVILFPEPSIFETAILLDREIGQDGSQ